MSLLMSAVCRHTIAARDDCSDRCLTVYVLPALQLQGEDGGGTCPACMLLQAELVAQSGKCKALQALNAAVVEAWLAQTPAEAHEGVLAKVSELQAEHLPTESMQQAAADPPGSEAVQQLQKQLTDANLQIEAQVAAIKALEAKLQSAHAALSQADGGAVSGNETQAGSQPSPDTAEATAPADAVPNEGAETAPPTAGGDSESSTQGGAQSGDTKDAAPAASGQADKSDASPATGNDSEMTAATPTVDSTPAEAKAEEGSALEASAPEQPGDPPAVGPEGSANAGNPEPPTTDGEAKLTGDPSAAKSSGQGGDSKHEDPQPETPQGSSQAPAEEPAGSPAAPPPAAEETAGAVEGSSGTTDEAQSVPKGTSEGETPEVTTANGDGEATPAAAAAAAGAAAELEKAKLAADEALRVCQEKLAEAEKMIRCLTGHTHPTVDFLCFYALVLLPTRSCPPLHPPRPCLCAPLRFPSCSHFR